MIQTKENKGITVIALVITVIILLIIAVVGISLIKGEDGVFTKADNASKKYENAELQEKETIDLYSTILANFDSSDGAEPDYNSKLINDFRIKTTLNNFDALIEIDGRISTIDTSKIVGYIIVIDNEAKTVVKSLPAKYKLKAGKTSLISVIAIDKNANMKRSVNTEKETTPQVKKTILEYPILTLKGVANIECLDEDGNTWYDLDLDLECTSEIAIKNEAYDDDENTSYSTERNVNQYLYIANEVIGKTIRIYYSGSNQMFLQTRINETDNKGVNLGTWGDGQPVGSYVDVKVTSGNQYLCIRGYYGPMYIHEIYILD